MVLGRGNRLSLYESSTTSAKTDQGSVKCKKVNRRKWRMAFGDELVGEDSDSDDLSGEGHEVAVVSALDIVTDATTL